MAAKSIKSLDLHRMTQILTIVDKQRSRAVSIRLRSKILSFVLPFCIFSVIVVVQPYNYLAVDQSNYITNYYIFYQLIIK